MFALLSAVLFAAVTLLAGPVRMPADLTQTREQPRPPAAIQPTPPAVLQPAPPAVVRPGPSAALQPGRPAAVAGTEGHGLRVRAGPSASRPVVTTVHEGAVVEVVAGPVRDGDDVWYQVKTGEASGWCSGRYLVPGNTGRETSHVAGRRTFVARVTAYADGVDGVPVRAMTYSGTRTRWGVVAVDPKVVPIGSLLTIEGYAGTTFVAEDTGGGIRGEAIDLWLPDPQAARAFGTQRRRVTIVREGPAR